MIDPVVTSIELVRRDANLRTLVALRIAEKHKFGLPDTDPLRWDKETQAQAVQLNQAPGTTPDWSSGRTLVRLEARCYGASAREAAQVAQKLIALTHAADRVIVPTDDGNAFLYWLLPVDSPTAGFDPVIELDYVLVPLHAAVAEDAVP